MTNFSLPEERSWELTTQKGEIKRLIVNKKGEIELLDPFIWECIRCGEKAITPTSDNPAFCPHCNKRDVFKPLFPPEFKSLQSDQWHIPWQIPPEPKTADIKWLYHNLKDCISKHLVLTKEEEYDILTKWTMATWRVEDFFSIPYLLARGEIESGKTRLLEVLDQLAYRVIPTVGISPAVLRKQIGWFKCTCAIDQAEDQLNRKFEAGQEMYRIVLAGYKRGMYVARCREGDPTKIDYNDPFGFKALASTKSFDPAVDSRCIIFDMEEAVPELKDIDIEWCSRLRAQLLFWRLQNDVVPRKVNTELTGRSRELFMSILSLSEFLGGKDEVESFAEEHRKRRLMELGSQFNAALVEALIKISTRTQENAEVYIRQIKDVFTEDLGMDPAGLSTRIGNALKDLGFKKERSGAKGVYVNIVTDENAKKLAYWKRKYNIKS